MRMIFLATSFFVLVACIADRNCYYGKVTDGWPQYMGNGSYRVRKLDTRNEECVSLRLEILGGGDGWMVGW